MHLAELLQTESHDILAQAEEAIGRAHLKHYQKDGPEHTRERLKALYVLAMRGVKERNLGPMIAHAEEIAERRFSSGFDLWEVQTAFNVLEEAIWTRILAILTPTEFPEAIGLISTILGAGKDALARRYVSLASKSRVTSLDLHSLFTGIEA